MKRILFYIAIGSVALAGFGAGVLIRWFVGVGQPTVSDVAPSDINIGTSVIVQRRAFDGQAVTSTASASGKFPPLVAVMIDNHPDAEPLAGITQASVVYEAPVEAPYTRLLALYPLASADTFPIGPVRSARPYFVEIAREYDALCAHVGGSPESLALLAQNVVRDVNEYSRGHLFWRERARFSPHHIMTTAADMEKGRQQYFPSVTSSAVASWEWSEAFDHGIVSSTFDIATITSTSVVASSTTSVNMPRLVPSFTVRFRQGGPVIRWEYDPRTMRYARIVSGRAQKDPDGWPIQATSIIVQHVRAEILDAVGRLRIDLLGSGDAVVYRNGARINGVWRKTKSDERTQWFDQNHQSIALNPGQVWVLLVDQRGRVIDGE